MQDKENQQRAVGQDNGEEEKPNFEITETVETVNGRETKITHTPIELETDPCVIAAYKMKFPKEFAKRFGK